MNHKPIVLITGAAGDIGSRLVKALSRGYCVIGMDRPGRPASIPMLEADLSDEASIDKALRGFADRWGARIASTRR
jgi:nucleoside-diphosphate-sugar epimerase